MKVLVTGASGFLGGHLVEMLVEAGHDVRGLVRRTSNTALLEQLGVELVVGDLKDEDSLRRAVQGVEAVVHAASTMGGVPAEYVEATVKGTRALLQAAEEAGVRRFVHVSSISVYPMRKPDDGEPVPEDSPYETEPRFLTNYTKSKIGSERAALEFAERDTMEVVVLRPGILYGPRGRWNLSRMGYPGGKGWYIVVGNGRNTLPVCYVRNCARAVMLALEREQVETGPFCIVDDENFTQREYLRRLKREVRPKLKIVCVPYVLARAAGWFFGLGMRLLGRSNPLHPAHMVACRRRLTYPNQRAKEVLGWRPETGKDRALAATMEHFAARERLSRRADLRALRRLRRGGRPLTACLVGCGMIARAHLKTLTRLANVTVAGLCDLDEEAAAALGEEFGVSHTYTEVETMLDAEDPDVVHVLTPPQSHLQMVRAAATRGCHVLVEKPMAMDAAEARRMLACAEENGVRLCVDHNHLYDPVMVKARRLVELGAVGDVIWVESYYGFNLGNNPGARYMTPGGRNHWTFALPGGLYQNLAPHPLSVALDVIGGPRSIVAEALPTRVVQHQPTDELRMVLRDDARGGLVTVSLAASPRFQYLKIYGTRMTVLVDFLNKWIVTHRVMKGVPKPISRAMMNLGESWAILRGTLSGMLKVLLRRWTPYEGMDLLIREFYASIQDGREPPVTAEEGLAVMEAMDRAWELIGRQDADASAPHAEDAVHADAR